LTSQCGSTERIGPEPSVQELEQEQRTQGSKFLLANGQESTALEPAAAIPAKAEFALGTAPIEVGNVTIAAAIHPEGAEADHWVLPLNFGVGRPERQQFRQRGRTQAVRLHVDEDFLGGHHLVQVDELGNDLCRSRSHDLEIPRVDGVVRPVVATGRHHLLDRLAVVDRDEEPSHREPVGVREELLEILAGHATRLRLGDQLAQLLDADVHLLSFSICCQTALHPALLPDILLPITDRHSLSQEKFLTFF